jgi:hypothetical protein
MWNYLFAAAVMTAIPQAVPNCPLPHQKPMLVVQLFFGRDIAGRGPVTEAEWNSFEQTAIAKNFADGFTVSDGMGQWLDPKTQRVVHEPSKIVVVAAPSAPNLAGRIEAVIAGYRTRFHQQSVGVLTMTECGRF